MIIKNQIDYRTEIINSFPLLPTPLVIIKDKINYRTEIINYFPLLPTPYSLLPLFRRDILEITSKLMLFKLLSPDLGKMFNKLPLKTILIVPFILQIVSVVGLVGYFSLTNGRQTVDTLANQLTNEISTRIEQHVLGYLNKSHQVLTPPAGSPALSRRGASYGKAGRYLCSLSLFWI